MELREGKTWKSGAFQDPQLKAYTAMMTAMWTLITIIKDNTQQPWLRVCALAVSIYFTVSQVALRSSHVL